MFLSLYIIKQLIPCKKLMVDLWSVAGNKRLRMCTSSNIDPCPRESTVLMCYGTVDRYQVRFKLYAELLPLHSTLIYSTCQVISLRRGLGNIVYQRVIHVFPSNCLIILNCAKYKKNITS